MSGELEYLHCPNALTNPNVKFFYMPRRGDYLCVPLLDARGEAIGILGVDNLGAPAGLSEEGIALILAQARTLRDKWTVIEAARIAKEKAELAAMKAEYAKHQAALEAELATMQEAGGEEEPVEPDPFKINAAKFKAARANLLALDKNKLAEIRGYKVVKPEVVRAVKAVFYVLGLAKRLPKWDKTKAMLDKKLPWGGDLLAKIEAFDPAKKKRTKPFARAIKRLADLTDEQTKKVSFVAFLLSSWVRSANEVFEEAVKVRAVAEDAREAARAAAADAAAAAEGEGEEGASAPAPVELPEIPPEVAVDEEETEEDEEEAEADEGEGEEEEEEGA